MPYFYQHPSGRTVIVKSLDELLNMDDQDIWASNRGTAINNPFFDTHSGEEYIEEEDILSFDLPDISSIEEIELEEPLDD